MVSEPEFWTQWQREIDQTRAKEAARQRRTNKAIGAAFFSVVVLIAAGVVFQKWQSRVRYPKQWDPKVAQIATNVERLRGLKFKRPVYVLAVPADEFDERIRAEENASTWESGVANVKDYTLVCSQGSSGEWAPCRIGARSVEPVGEVLKILKVTQSEDVLPQMPMSVVGATVLARYNVERKRVEVRGPIDGVTKAILAHELTHVLQDQHFTLSCACRTLDESLGYRSLTEGDASRIEMQFLLGQTPSEAAADQLIADKIDADVVRRVEEAAATSTFSDEGNDIRLRLSAFPYEEGRDFAEQLVRAGGQDNLDRAFTNPPQSSAEIFQQRIRQTGPTLVEVDPLGREYTTRPIPIGLWYWRESLRNNDMDDSLDVVTEAWTGDATSSYYASEPERVCFLSRIGLGGKNSRAAAHALEKLAATFEEHEFTSNLNAEAPSIAIGGCHRQSNTVEKIRDLVRNAPPTNGPAISNKQEKCLALPTLEQQTACLMGDALNHTPKR